jgi:RNA polymerase sigma factor (sigma-70 family)
MRYRLSPDDAADVFQAVWMELYSELPNLRNAAGIRAWLVTVAAHKCYHLKRMPAAKSIESEAEQLPGPSLTAEWLARFEKEQTLREAMAELPERCRALVRMLFYQEPVMPYAEVAQALGLAEGSIGFIRGRCLKKLRALLERKGF